jgi:hypothetical protein
MLEAIAKGQKKAAKKGKKRKKRDYRDDSSSSSSFLSRWSPSPWMKWSAGIVGYGFR